MKHPEFTKLSYWIAAVWLAVIAGCSLTPVAPTADATADASESVARSQQKTDQIELTVEASPAKLRLSDELLLTVTIRKPVDLRIDLPSFDESLAEFTIRDLQHPLPKLDGPFEIVQQLYRLEPTRVGRQTIIPPAVNYFPGGAPSQKEPSAESQQIIEVDPLEIEVTSELANQSPNLDQLRPENPPVDLPVKRRNLAVWIALLAVTVSLLAVVIARLVTKRKQAAIQLSPRELARLELQKLMDDNWSKLDPKRYFVELTGIVRRFIERATGVRAPEQTTEEFLRTIASDRLFNDEVQLRLREFLESADLVKFAGLKPSSQQIAHSLDRASRFIDSEVYSREQTST